MNIVAKQLYTRYTANYICLERYRRAKQKIFKNV